MRYLIIVGLFLALSLGQVAGQSKEPQEPIEIESLWSVNYDDFFNITTGYELKLLPQISLNIEMGLGAQPRYFSKYSTDIDAWALLGKLDANILYYYNFKKRVAKGRNTKYNAANFFTFGFQYLPNIAYLGKTKHGIEDTGMTYGAWGLRRNLGRHFTFQGEVGFGVQREFSGTDKETLHPQLVLNIQFSYKF